jgi:hypothetical protein
LKEPKISQIRGGVTTEHKFKRETPMHTSTISIQINENEFDGEKSETNYLHNPTIHDKIKVLMDQREIIKSTVQNSVICNNKHELKIREKFKLNQKAKRYKSTRKNIKSNANMGPIILQLNRE